MLHLKPTVEYNIASIKQRILKMWISGRPDVYYFSKSVYREYTFSENK